MHLIIACFELEQDLAITDLQEGFYSFQSGEAGLFQFESTQNLKTVQVCLTQNLKTVQLLMWMQRG